MSRTSSSTECGVSLAFDELPAAVQVALGRVVFDLMRRQMKRQWHLRGIDEGAPFPSAAGNRREAKRLPVFSEDHVAGTFQLRSLGGPLDASLPAPLPHRVALRDLSVGGCSFYCDAAGAPPRGALVGLELTCDDEVLVLRGRVARVWPARRPR
ncbi:MAG: hypothetical protein IT371_16265 [Deltaproteobacteria bacterium]|nr:hypothetical protein [Deltaproteobacteria bacterium]